MMNIPSVCPKAPLSQNHSPRFGLGLSNAAHLPMPIRNEALADTLHDWFKWTGRSNALPFNMSLQDVASRSMTLFGIYIPQSVIAIKNDNHIFETIGRNAIVWVATILLAMWSKSETFGFNKLVDGLLQAQLSPEQLESFGRVLAARKKVTLPTSLPPEAEFFEILKAANITFNPKESQKAFWARAQQKDVDGILGLYQKLQTGALPGMFESQRQRFLKQIPGTVQLGLHQGNPAAESLLAHVEKSLPQQPKLLERLQNTWGRFSEWKNIQFNHWGLKGDYFDILKAANIPFSPQDRQKATWAGLGRGEMEAILNLEEKLKQGVVAGISEIERGKLLELIPSFLKRRNAALFLVGIPYIATQTYLIGSLAMQVVFHFIAPFDHDFEGNKPKKEKDDGHHPHTNPGLTGVPTNFQSVPMGKIPRTAFANFQGGGH